MIITTPNEEDLETGKVLCPECGSVFHGGQHSSWDKQKLSALMEQSGFRAVLCRAQTFRTPSILNRARGLVAAVTGAKPLNLMFVGRKDASRESSTL